MVLLQNKLHSKVHYKLYITKIPKKAIQLMRQSKQIKWNGQKVSLLLPVLPIYIFFCKNNN